MGVRLVREAAIRAVELAEAAAAHGTFGVGGVLLGPHFEPLHECGNRVVQGGRTIDPTAHVERQLIDWYFATRQKGINLPAAEQCTIVSSLDPCMQCTGAILATGFRCLAIAPDLMAGVHYAGWNSLNSLPRELRDIAVQRLGCFGVSGERSYVGPDDSILSATEIDQSLLVRSENALLKTLNAVQGMVAATASEDGFSDATLPELQTKCDGIQIETLIRVEPGAVHERMRRLALKKPGEAPDVACFLDYKKQLAVFAEDRTENSPIRTAMMELVRGYAKLRWMGARKLGVAPSHPKHCSLYTLKGPGRDPLSVMAIGAVGSMLEGPVREPQKYWRYFHARQSTDELNAMVRCFPPLYSDIIRVYPMLLNRTSD